MTKRWNAKRGERTGARERLLVQRLRVVEERRAGVALISAALDQTRYCSAIVRADVFKLALLAVNLTALVTISPLNSVRST